MICLLVLIILASSVVAFAYAVFPAYCWYSDSNDIGFWASTPTIWRCNFSTNNSFSFTTCYNTARTQWANASIATIDGGTNPSSYQIAFFGGSESVIATNLGVSSASLNGKAGITKLYGSLFGYMNYSGSTKNLNQLSFSMTGIIDRGLSLDMQKNVCIHELGHSLGWYGHSNINTNVMYYNTTSVKVLTTMDKNHLTQAY